jgi:hypothetical protein
MPAEQRALTFGMLFEDGEVKVIGDEPANTDYDPDRSEKAHTARRRLVAFEVSSHDTSLNSPAGGGWRKVSHPMLTPVLTPEAGR